MNIFVLDLDPEIAARSQCNKHIVKMPTEAAQLLCNAHRCLDGYEVTERTKIGRRIKRWKLRDSRQDVLMKSTHINHPCSIWAREHSANYWWLYCHYRFLCEEYQHRYKKQHAAWTKYHHILQDTPENMPEVRQPMPDHFAMGMKSYEHFIVDNDPVASYRAYYCDKIHRMEMLWTNRETPDWFIKGTQKNAYL